MENEMVGHFPFGDGRTRNGSTLSRFVSGVDVFVGQVIVGVRATAINQMTPVARSPWLVRHLRQFATISNDPYQGQTLG